MYFLKDTLQHYWKWCRENDIKDNISVIEEGFYDAFVKNGVQQNSTSTRTRYVTLLLLIVKMLKWMNELSKLLVKLISVVPNANVNIRNDLTTCS